MYFHYTDKQTFFQGRRKTTKRKKPLSAIKSKQGRSEFDPENLDGLNKHGS